MSEPRNHFVYRIFNAEGRLLYVGCSKQPSRRWKEHCSQRPGFKFIDTRFRVQGPYVRSVALDIERRALRTESPLLGCATRSDSQHAEHLEAERRFAELPHLPGPVMEWMDFEARPLDGFPGWWRAFSYGKPTSVFPEANLRGDMGIERWRLKALS